MGTQGCYYSPCPERISESPSLDKKIKNGLDCLAHPFHFICIHPNNNKIKGSQRELPRPLAGVRGNANKLFSTIKEHINQKRPSARNRTLHRKPFEELALTAILSRRNRTASLPPLWDMCNPLHLDGIRKARARFLLLARCV